MEYDSLQDQLNNNLCLIVLFLCEIQSIRQRVLEKEKEVEDIRRTSLASHRKKSIK